MSDIPESDWKTLRSLKEAALDRFCRKVLDELVRVSTDAPLSAHERYLAVFKLIQARDQDLAHAFNGLRRPSALIQMRLMYRQGLFTEEEIAHFSEEIRVHISR